MGYNGPQGVFIKYDMNLGGVHHFPQGRVKGRTPTAQGGREGGSSPACPPCGPVCLQYLFKVSKSKV